MRKIIVLYIVATILAATGCQRQPVPTIEEGEATVTFSVTLPAQVPVTSRATFSDTDIENIDVLIFDQANKFIERVKIDNIAGSGSVKSFSMRLDFTPNARTFHIVANGRDAADADKVNFSAIALGMTEDTAIPLLRTTAASLNETTVMPLIMWGRISVPAVNQPVINVSNAKLIRSLAAVTVRTSSPTAENGLNNFTLSSITLHNAPAYGRVAPTDYSSSNSVPATPTVPAGVTMVNYHETSYWANGTSPVIYMYERENNSSNHVSLIIRGSYNGTEGYYRVVLADDQGALMNVVRNHRYIVTVVKADGAGYQTIQEAVSNAPSNVLKAIITDERDDVFLIVSDGSNELGVSVNHIGLEGSHTSTAVELATVFATKDATLTATTSASSPLTGLSLSPLQPDGTRKLTATWSSTSVQAAEIIVSDGSLKHTIKLESNTFQGDFSDNLQLSIYKLFGSANKPWSATIIQGSSYAKLHSGISQFADITDMTIGSQSLESRMNSDAYLYMSNGSGIVVVDYSCIDNASLRVGRIIVNQ